MGVHRSSRDDAVTALGSCLIVFALESSARSSTFHPLSVIVLEGVCSGTAGFESDCRSIRKPRLEPGSLPRSVIEARPLAICGGNQSLNETGASPVAFRHGAIPIELTTQPVQCWTLTEPPW